MLDAISILRLHDRATAHAHDETLPMPRPASPFEQAVLTQHLANFDLWHEEDRARDLHASDATIAAVKRSIDGINQQRNDLAEQLDLQLLSAAPKQPQPEAPLHSETPGLIIDRLSILALKLFHTEEQLHRSTPQHRALNQERLQILLAQRSDLAACLDALWADVLAGRRRFKLYRQLKMYNDPALNPVLYSRAEDGPA